MKKEDLLRYTGSLQQVAYARRITYDEGRARGLNAVEVKNGPLRFVAMIDKCLDICEMSWRGEQINFLSKPGLNGRNPFDTHGGEAQRSIMGGLFFTCGYENICAPYTDAAGKEYPMHGRMRTSPAEHVSIDEHWEGDDYVITVSGDIREAELFGENILLHRSISTRLGSPEIRIVDEVRNEAFRSETMMLMYHCNIGYPMLNENCRVVIPTGKVTARDAVSRANIERYDRMDPPKDNEDEYVYLHDLGEDENGMSFAAVVDDERALGLCIDFDHKALPYFGQWKSTASGDYVMGLEPGNAPVYGRSFCEQNNILPTIMPQSEKRFELKFSIVEGKAAISELDDRKRRILNT